MSVRLGSQISRTAACEPDTTTDRSVIIINDKQRGHGFKDRAFICCECNPDLSVVVVLW
jgi:hypothetical protein